MAGTVLIVEDDPNTVNIVRLYLNRDGYKVLSSDDGREGLRLAREAQPDIVVLDLMLPGIDGIEICRTLRQESDVPIVMLTARVEEEDRLMGLDTGADDYITKPFSPRELAARVRAVLRRTSRDALERGPQQLVYGDIVASIPEHSVTVAGEKLRLTPTEFRLLAMIMREPERIFTRDQIIDGVFGYDFNGFDRTVDVHVSNLRRKLEAGPDRAQIIHTIYGVGYKFGNA